MNGLVIDHGTGHRGTVDEWVATFGRFWAEGSSQLDNFMNMLGPNVRLRAPGLRSTLGREAGKDAFQRTFRVMPDLTAKVLAHGAQANTLFIEMTFSATIGGGKFEWPNVDRFTFEDGVAIERVAYFNPLRLQRAFVRSPSGWAQLAKQVLTR